MVVYLRNPLGIAHSGLENIGDSQASDFYQIQRAIDAKFSDAGFEERLYLTECKDIVIELRRNGCGKSLDEATKEELRKHVGGAITVSANEILVRTSEPKAIGGVWIVGDIMQNTQSGKKGR